jgi:hypothetical protein
MPLGRRAFLSAVGGGLAAAAGLSPGTGRGGPVAALIGCGAEEDGRFVAAGLDLGGTVAFQLSLPSRGHGAAFCRTRFETVVFARRPGTFAAVVDAASGGLRHWIEAVPGRHFYGHGAFSADGSTLFATENDYAAGRGVLGVYDAADRYKRLGEFPSHGVGPHEVRLMPDGVTLAVANGGIRTHPDHDREKLNLESMAPNLSFVEARTGALMGQAGLAKPLHKLSIRHIDVNRRGRVAVAMQYEGDRRDAVPLAGLCDAGGEIHLLHAPAPNERRLRQYTGSIAFDTSGEVLAVSSPRGHVVTFWDAGTGAYLRQIEATDTSGVVRTGTPGTFLVTGGDGAIRLAEAWTGASTALRAPNRQLRWDNHLYPMAEPIS